MREFKEIFKELKEDFAMLPIVELEKKFERKLEAKENPSSDFLYNALILDAQGETSLEQPEWTFVAARVHLKKLYKDALANRGNNSLVTLIDRLIDEGVYDKGIKEKYSAKEMKELEKEIDAERDKLFNYVGIYTLSDRYLAKSKDGKVIELPQERYMIISMGIMIDEEKSVRLERVKEAYWALSNSYMTVATPTFSNAGKVGAQLSSCFIDTVSDDLRGIYDSNSDVAQISKNGGGLGVYMGKVRSRGSSIRGYKDVSGGVVPWIKQLNNTAVSVDQLGKRKGAVAIYLDVWHKDIFPFLDLKLNNGDERMRAHDIFTGVTIPNIFYEAVEARGDWYLFDPHEVREVMGFNLEDFYDEADDDGTFRKKYQECVDNEELSKIKIPAIEIMKRIMISQLETGTPFMFYRDKVNQLNANSHEGIIYCSNLCTEITQNQSATTVKKEYINEDDEIVIIKKPGDMVVCNLSSVNLARAYTDGVMERLISIQVRMLDNTIDINNLPIPQAEVTNQKYRAVGIGTFGLHHLLALEGIDWESEEAVIFSDKLYENFAYLAIKASMEIAKEKGSYKLFEGSDWQTGEYFEKRGYDSYRWNELKEQVKKYGIRNSYLMAVAPNSSTSVIAGSTASVDPIFDLEYSEEKKDFRIMVTAPDYNDETKDFYKRARDIDQIWSIKQNAMRQKHIDQAISFNLYVKNDVKAKDLLNYHLTAWRSGFKTTYYVRSTTAASE